ncbi:MAG: hypothetical protein JSV31_17210 [Desulfobacterales bacterium]|nr:MAG: hypothetical protein JSV31_17210 [Desulfobacterales bacterium]
MEEAGQKINSFEEWKIEMLKLAEIAVSEGRLMNAAFFYRAKEKRGTVVLHGGFDSFM